MAAGLSNWLCSRYFKKQAQSLSVKPLTKCVYPRWLKYSTYKGTYWHQNVLPLQRAVWTRWNPFESSSNSDSDPLKLPYVRSNTHCHFFLTTWIHVAIFNSLLNAHSFPSAMIPDFYLMPKPLILLEKEPNTYTDRRQLNLQKNWTSTTGVFLEGLMCELVCGSKHSIGNATNICLKIYILKEIPILCLPLEFCFKGKCTCRWLQIELSSSTNISHLFFHWVRKQIIRLRTTLTWRSSKRSLQVVSVNILVGLCFPPEGLSPSSSFGPHILFLFSFLLVSLHLPRRQLLVLSGHSSEIIPVLQSPYILQIWKQPKPRGFETTLLLFQFLNHPFHHASLQVGLHNLCNIFQCVDRKNQQVWSKNELSR